MTPISDKGAKGSNVTTKDNDGTITEVNNFNPNDPNLYNLVPMRSDLFATEQTAADSDITLPGTGTPPTNPFKDGREYSFLSEKKGLKSPNRTQVQESSSAAKPLVNRGEGTEEDKRKWVNFLNSPRNSKPNTPNRDVVSKFLNYDPGSRSGSEESDIDEESKDQDMVDLT